MECRHVIDFSRNKEIFWLTVHVKDNCFWSKWSTVFLCLEKHDFPKSFLSKCLLIFMQFVQ